VNLSPVNRISAIAAGFKLKTFGDAFKLSVFTGMGIVGAVIASRRHGGGLPKIATAIDLGCTYCPVLIFSLLGCLRVGKRGGRYGLKKRNSFQ